MVIRHNERIHNGECSRKMMRLMIKA